ncbi:unnamed protein product [Closterium sp. NIES-54]
MIEFVPSSIIKIVNDPCPSAPSATAATTTPATAAPATAAPTYCATMASLRVLAFDHEGRLVQFDTWLYDLQLYLLSDIKDGVSLFDCMSGAATAPPTTAHSATRSQWLSRDAAAQSAIRNHLPLAECAHFGQHRTAYTLDHFLSLNPTSLTVDLLEQHLLAAETSAFGVGAARGTPRPPFFEGCSPSPLAPSYASAAAANVSVAEDVGAASASAKRRSGKGKGGKGGGGGSRGGGGGSGSGGGGSSGGGGGGGTGGGSGGFGGGGGGVGGSGGSGTGGGGTGARRVGSRGGQRQSLPPLPPSLAPPCLPCVEGRQRAAPDSSSFPPKTAPLQTLHMDVWGPARVSGQSRERYFLLVVDDYTRYTTIFPLRSKGQFVDVLIPWIRTVRLQLRERFSQDLPILRLHSDRGGEFSSNLLRDFCRGKGILQSFTLPDSPQQNGIAERRIGLVMEVARTSMIHAAAPHFLWPFAVQHAAHQLNLWPHVSLPETSPTLRWTGEVGDFYHPTSRRVFSSQDVTFDEPVPFYRLFPYRSTPPPPPLLFLAPGPPSVDPLPGPAPVQVAVGSGAARGAASGGAVLGVVESEGAETGGAEPGGVETRGAEPEGVEIGGAASEGAESGGAEPEVAASPGGSAGASPRLSPQQLREWFVRRARLRSGATGAGGGGAARAGGAGVAARVGVTGGTATTGLGGARTRSTGAAKPGGVEGAGARDPTESGATGAGGFGTGGVGAGGAGVGGTSAGGARVGGPGVGGVGAGGAGAVDPGGAPASLLPAPSPYTEHSGDLTERREHASCPVSPVCNARCVPCSHPPPVPGTHAMTLRSSSIPVRVLLPAPRESSLPEVPDLESNRARAASPTLSCLLATAVTDPSFESAAVSALVPELLDFAAACRLDYTIALVAESVSASPPSVGGECALGTDFLEDRQEAFECLAAAVPRSASMLLAREGDPDAPDIPTPRSYAESITGPYSSQWQAAMDVEMASKKSTGTYVDEVPPPGANIVDGMCIFRVKRPPGSSPAFKARYVARCFSQRQGTEYFQTFFPTPKMTALWVLLHVAAQREYELHSLDFSTAFLQGSLHEEIWLRRPPGFTESFPVAPPSNESVEPSGPYPELVGCLMYLMTCTRPDLAYPLSLLACYVAPDRHQKVHWDAAKRVLRYLCSTSGMWLVLGGRGPVVLTGHVDASWVDNSAMQPSSQGYTFSLGCGSVSWRSTRLSAVLSSTCEAEIYAGAMAAQELRWLTYLLTDLGEQPRITRDRAQHTITLTQSHMVQQVLQRFGFTYSSPQSTPLPTGHSLSAPPSDESVEPSGPYPELVGCLITRPVMLSVVQRYVTTYPTCQAMKSSRQRPAGLLQPLEPPERTWQQVTMDFVTGLPADTSSTNLVLVIVDRLTKMAHLAP